MQLALADVETHEPPALAVRRGRAAARGLALASMAIVAVTASGCACTARAGAGGTTILRDGAAPEAAVTAGVGPGGKQAGAPITASLEYLGGDTGSATLTFGAELLRHPRPHGFRLGLRAGPLWTIGDGDGDARAVFVAEAAWIVALSRRTNYSEGIAFDLFTAFSPEQQGPGPWFGLRVSYEVDENWSFRGWP